MRVDLFDFDLPDDLIAQRPATPRDSARLLDVAPDGLHDRSRPRPAEACCAAVTCWSSTTPR